MAAAASSHGETARVEVVSPKDTSAMTTTDEALKAVSASFEPPVDPDAQNTITDFIDFTEYLPADMVRSLTLIGSLDERYSDASIKVNDLTTTWSQLPSMPPNSRPAPVKVRADISEHLKLAVDSRVAAHAESVRMSENVNHHYNKAKVLLDKLKKMMETYPAEDQLSPVETKSPQLTRAKLTVRATGDGTGPKVHRHRIPRITVPGEVLAPYDIEYDTTSDDSDVSSDDSDIRRTPAPKIKIVTHRPPKSTPRSSRVLSYPSAALTAAQAASAAALLNPPPADAVIGSSHAPWLRLTDYELAKLRKRMKKNAAWTPSETMVVRELEKLGRGPEQYKIAKKQAEDEGRVFEAEVPAATLENDSGKHLPAGAISADRLATDNMPTSNRGMKLNEAKKLKKEIMAKLAAEESQTSTKDLDQKARMIIAQHKEAEARAQSKRKRDGESSASGAKEDPTTPRPLPKRAKIETPVPPPQHPGFHNRRNSSMSHTQTPGSTATGQTETPVPIPTLGKTTISPTPNNGKTVTTSVPVKPPAETPVPLPKIEKRTITPVYPPVREMRSREAKREPQDEGSLTTPQATTEGRPRRSVSRGLTPAPDGRRPGSRGKATSQEPASAATDRPRRASTTRTTPAPESRQRPKRPAPGIVSRTSSGGNSAVGARKAAPKKKARMTKKDRDQSADVETEEVDVDDEGNPIDPDEARYCLCNRVSFGTMIQCERGESCKGEWFHLECVGLTEIPARRTQWYCPDCRITLNIGEKGEVSSRGVKT